MNDLLCSSLSGSSFRFSNITSLWTAIITPFTSDNNVDYLTLKILLKHQKQAKNGVIIFGSTGEGNSLSLNEKLSIIKITSEVQDLPIIVCIPGINIIDNAELINICENFSNICGYLLTTPIYTKPGIIGQTKWFEFIMNMTQKPCMLYNIPSRSGVPLYHDTIKNLKDHPRLVAIKDSGGNLDLMKEYNNINPKIEIFCGDDSLLSQATKITQISGLISVISNILPSELHIYVKYYCEYINNESKSYEFDNKDRKNNNIDFSLDFLTNIAIEIANSGVNPLPIKYLMYRLGQIKHMTVRLPLDFLDINESIINHSFESIKNKNIQNKNISYYSDSKSSIELKNENESTQKSIKIHNNSELDSYVNSIDDDVFLKMLNEGQIRSAEYNIETDIWNVNKFVKQKILDIFSNHKSECLDQFSSQYIGFVDKLILLPRKFTAEDNIRMVPGGSSIREGVYIGKKCVIMPPSYINIGSYIDEETVVDSHVLIGSCAQIGKRVHIGAGVKIGGVIDPVGNLPVIIENDVFIGAGSIILEGIIIKEKAVIAPGVILSGSTPIYDITQLKIYKGIIPKNALVVPGSRSINRSSTSQDWINKNGLQANCPIIIKYRDSNTDIALEIENIIK